MRKIVLMVCAMFAMAGLASTPPEAPAKDAGGRNVQKTRAYKRTVTRHTPGERGELSIGRVMSPASTGVNALQRVVTSPKMLRQRPKVEGSAEVPLIYGNVVYSAAGVKDGVYEIPSSESMTFKAKFLGPWGLGGCVLHDGVYYTHKLDPDGYVDSCVGYDWETGESVYDTEIKRAAISVGMSEYNGVVYGIFSNSRNNGYRLGTCVYTDEGPSVTEIAPLEGRGWCAFAIDGNGQGYGICATYEDDYYDDATLYKIDITDGTVTEVGPTEITSDYTTAMAFERRTNRLFWTVAQFGGSYLTEIDTSTGKATVIYKFPGDEQVTGLHIPTLPGPDSAPKPENLAAQFPNGGLTGAVTFDIPATLNGGDPATGDVKYKVTLNGGTIGSGTSAYGSSVSCNATVPASGYYDIAAVLTNNVGDGPVANLHTYIGAGVPVTPEVQLERGETGDMTITWQAVGATVEGGYIDPSGVSYDVMRYPDEVSVVTGLKTTTYTENLPVPAEGIFAYYYTVTAHNADVVSAPGKSNEIVVGNGWHVPYAYNFDDPYNFQFYTVVDADEDMETWKLLENSLRLKIPSDAPSDDWVITPGIYMEAGKLYSFEMDARCYTKSSPSRIEVKWGHDADPDAMSNVALEPTDITNPEWEHVKARIIPTESGYYNIGVHAINDKFNFYTYLDNFEVIYDTDVPAKPSDFEVEPGENGGLFATVSFNTPTQFVSGKPIDTIDKVVVTMDGDEIYSSTTVKPGMPISCAGTVDKEGTYRFSARVYAHDGDKELEGDAAAMSMYIGIDYPEAPQQLAMTEPEEPGVVRLDWQSVTNDVRGAVLPDVHYNIYKIEGLSIVPRGTDVTATDYTYRMVESGRQEFVQLGVAAVSSRGEGEMSIVHGFAGTPYELYRESFANRSLSHPLAISHINYFEEEPMWLACDDTTIKGMKSADGDNGYIVMSVDYADEASSLMLGKMSLAGLNEPVFSLYAFNIEGQNGGDDDNVIDIYVRDFTPEAQYTKVLSTKLADTGTKETWNKIVADLTPYKDKTVEIMVAVTVKNMSLTMLDSFRIADKVNKDLSVAIDVPAAVLPGEEFEVTAAVRNEADTDATAYTVRFRDSDNVVFATEESESLVCGAVSRIKVPYTLSGVAEEPLGFTAEVVYAGDENPDNNVSETAVVRPDLPLYPEPVALTGEVTAGGVSLEWTAPDLTIIRPLDVIDTFEDGEAGDNTYGTWTFVDRDQKTVGGVQNVDIPGLEAGVTTASFLILDSSLPQFNDDFTAHSGSKYLASFFCYDQTSAKDDWAISPLLSGKAQTVSFYARSFQDFYPESMEVYRSTGSLNPDDFVKIDEACVAAVPEEWTRYTVELPEGTRHFAVHSNSTDMFIFMLDDVSYTAGLDFSGLTLKGYNIYRNGVLLNDSPVAECSYLDTEATPQDNIYGITVVYAEGESKSSEKLRVLASGIAGTSAAPTVTTTTGRIIITGAEGLRIAVCSIDGYVIAETEGTQADTTIEAAPGIYLVRLGSATHKVMVR